jgi:hypothetical protein
MVNDGHFCTDNTRNETIAYLAVWVALRSFCNFLPSFDSWSLNWQRGSLGYSFASRMLYSCTVQNAPVLSTTILIAPFLRPQELVSAMQDERSLMMCGGFVCSANISCVRAGVAPCNMGIGQVTYEIRFFFWINIRFYNHFCIRFFV